MKPRQFRLYLVFGTLTLLGAALGLSLYAAKDGVMYYRTPSQVYEQTGELFNKTVRLGGLVTQGSYRQDVAAGSHSFRIKDNQHEIEVQFEGVLPALFAEGQGVVVDGILQPQEIYPLQFTASRVLAKHDENYRPPQVAEETTE